MPETLEYPVLTDAPTKQVVPKTDLLALALSRFGDWRPEAAALVAKWQGVVFDTTAPKERAKLDDAIAEVRAPRYKSQNVAKASKTELAQVSKAVGAEDQAVADTLAPVEAHLVGQRDAYRAKDAAEKAERERIEAERVAYHRAGIAAIRECVGRARGLASERIARGIVAVEEKAVDEATYQEFAGEAAVAKTETLEAMHALFDSAKEAEDAAAAVEAQRVEQARVAEEQHAEALRLADEAARIAEARALIANAEKEAADRIAAERAAWLAEQEAAKLKPEPVAILADEAPPPVERVPVEQLAVVAAEPPAPEPQPQSEFPALTLGEIKARIAPFSIQADGLEQLGFAPAATKQAAKLYLPSTWPAMRAAMVKHLEGIVA